MHTKVILFSDGGSRGNPGPAAAAFIVLSEDNVLLRKQSHFLGKRTNNEAEYEAIVAALESALQMGAQDVTSFLDSELVCKHLNGEYKVKDPDLKSLWNKAQKLRNCFKTVRFVNVPRTNKYIQQTDALVNEELDRSTH